MTIVSVVIPTYNRATRIARALTSVSDAALPAHEIIVVDDGSTDNTLEVVKSFGGPVTLIQQQNSGPAAARNRGMAAARGKYIAFLDSDDVMLPGLRQQSLDFLDSHPDVGVVFCDCIVRSPNGSVSPGYTASDRLWQVAHAQAPNSRLLVFDRESFFRGLLLDRCYLIPSLAMVRKTAVDQCGGFDDSLRGYEEWDFFTRLATRYSFAFAPEPGADIEKHDSNLSGNLNSMLAHGARILEGFLEGRVPVPDEDRPAIVRKMIDMSLGSAYFALQNGEHRTARRQLAQHMRKFGVTRRSIFLWAASWLTPAQLTRLRGFKSGVAA